MFHKNTRYSICALGTLVISACAAEVSVEENVGVAEQHLDACTTNTGKWQHLANLAVATADEMGELNTSQQFTIVPWNGGEKVALSTYGAAVCGERGGCPMVQGYLDLQELENDDLVPQSVFNVIDYRNTIVDGLKRQTMEMDQLVANQAWSQLPEDNSTTLLGEDGTATCGTPWVSFSVKRDFHFEFSSSGPIDGMNCTQITEPNDPHGWSDNYLCSERPLGLVWSSSGPVAGMTCINVNEPRELAWNDNYLCTPEDWGLSWSSTGKAPGKDCVAFTEPLEPRGWRNDYLCWDKDASLSHPQTLCQEFLLFGGAGQCQGNNPYIDFVVSSDDRFKIDPTDWVPPGGGGYNGCVTSLPFVSTDPGAEGACCYQDGLYGILVKFTTVPNTYWCYTG